MAEIALVGNLAPRPLAARLDTIARRADALADLLAELHRPAHAAVAGNPARSIRSVARDLDRVMLDDPRLRAVA